MSTAVTDRPLLSVREVAERLSVSEKTVRRIVERGELPVLVVGGQLRVDPDALEVFLHDGAVARLRREISAAIERGDGQQVERLRASYRALAAIDRPAAAQPRLEGR